MIFSKSTINKDDKDIKLDLPPQAMDGYIFTLKSMRQRHIKCGDCVESSLYPEKKHSCDCSNAPCLVKDWAFDAIEVVINIVGTDKCDGGWSVDGRDVKLIDNEGFAHDGRLLCFFLDKNRSRAEEYSKIARRTQADMVYVFGLLPDSKQIAEIMIVNGRQNVRFTINAEAQNTGVYSAEHYDQILEHKNEQREHVFTGLHGNLSFGQSSQFNHFGDGFENAILGDASSIRSLQYNLNQLKVLVFQRFRTHLSSTEAQKIEDKIEMRIYSLSLDFKIQTGQSESKEFKSLYEEFQEEVANYREVLYQKKVSEEQHLVEIQRVSDLLSIEPYQFEYLCSTLMEKLDYVKVIVTPRTNDKGIDIMAEKDGKKVVAQCKRYKNSVGSPDMQMFIGAMHNAGAEQGVYFTTGTFTREAETMAKSNGIILFGKDQLAKYLSLVDDCETSPHPIQSTIWDDGLEDLPY